jgi:hypothetical protein
MRQTAASLHEISEDADSEDEELFCLTEMTLTSDAWSWRLN